MRQGRKDNLRTAQRSKQTKTLHSQPLPIFFLLVLKNSTKAERMLTTMEWKLRSRQCSMLPCSVCLVEQHFVYLFFLWFMKCVCVCVHVCCQEPQNYIKIFVPANRTVLHWQFVIASSKINKKIKK